MDHNSTDLPQDQPDWMESRLKLSIRKQELDFEKQKSVASQTCQSFMKFAYIRMHLCVQFLWINCVFVPFLVCSSSLYFTFLYSSCVFWSVLFLSFLLCFFLYFTFLHFLSFPFLCFSFFFRVISESRKFFNWKFALIMWLCLSVCLSIRLSPCVVCLSVCLFVALNTYTKICMYIYIYLHMISCI